MTVISIGKSPFISLDTSSGVSSTVAAHPARMPPELAEFFIRFLTKKKSLVLDPFAGSNTTGYVASKLNRKWVSIEKNLDYIKGSQGWFTN